MPHRVNSTMAKETYQKLQEQQQNLPFRGAVRLDSYDKFLPPDLDEFEEKISPWLSNTKLNFRTWISPHLTS